MNTELRVGIVGFGSALPSHVRHNDHWPAEFRARDEERRKRDIVDIERTADGQTVTIARELAEGAIPYADDPFRGAKERRVIADSEEISDFEAEAVRRAVASAGLTVDDIDAVLVHSLIPDLLHPSNAPAVQQKAGLSRAAAIAIDNGCASPHVGAVLGSGLVSSGAFRNVVVVCSSAASRAVDTMNPASPVFGDGASAYVVSRVGGDRGLLGQFIRTDGSFRDAMVHATMVDGRPERAWYKYEGAIRLATLAPDRARETGRRQVEWCQEACQGALESAGLGIDDVDFFFGPQSVAWLNSSLARSIGVPPERTLDTFPEVGNIGSATLAFNLERAWRTGRVHDGDTILAYTPGAGLTRAAVVFRFQAPSHVQENT